MDEEWKLNSNEEKAYQVCTNSNTQTQKKAPQKVAAGL